MTVNFHFKPKWIHDTIYGQSFASIMELLAQQSNQA